MSDFRALKQLAGAAIVQGFADDIIELNQVLAFDLRFNLRHPKISAIYMLETPINGCHFEVVKRDGGRFHTGGDIAAKILGEEKAYMSSLEQIANNAKEQSGLIKQFCRKSDLFRQLYPQEAVEQEQKDRAKAMEEEYLNRAGGVMSRLANADKVLTEVVPPSPPSKPIVSSAVSARLRRKLRVNCEVQHAVSHAHLPKWLDFLHSKSGQVLGGGEVWLDSDPTGKFRFEAKGGQITLSRDGEVVGTWDTYDEAHKSLVLGMNSLPNPIFPLTRISYDRTVAGIPAADGLLRKAIRSQVTANICDTELWKFLSAS